MPQSPPKPILALNGGSASLKFGLYSVTEISIETVLSGEAETIGASTSTFRVLDSNGALIHNSTQAIPSLAAAAALTFEQLESELSSLHAIGHRIVHGGPHLVEHQLLTPAVRAELESAKDLAPLHTPPALAVIDAVSARFPSTPQVICLDTAFHRTLPDRARRLPLPAEAIEGGVRRYRAHGISLESAVHLLGPALREKCVIAHLGNGCSITAVYEGRSIDTTMGLTPAGGMMVGTRAGDLDPGVLIYPQRRHGWNADKLEQVIDRESGLLGVSGRSNDLRVLLAARENGDAASALALEMFAYEPRKTSHA
jgi:acetate kinase